MWTHTHARACTPVQTHISAKRMYIIINALYVCHNTLVTTAFVWVVTHESLYRLWLHCLGLCNCYIHWMISRVLLHCNITADHTSPHSSYWGSAVDLEWDFGRLWDSTSTSAYWQLGPFVAFKTEDNFWFPMYTQYATEIAHNRLCTIDIASCTR